MKRILDFGTPLGNPSDGSFDLDINLLIALHRGTHFCVIAPINYPILHIMLFRHILTFIFKEIPSRILVFLLSFSH